MSGVLLPGPAALPESQGTAVPSAICFRKDANPPAAEHPLSPVEQEILSICLNSPEDPRDVGILHALLGVERQGGLTARP